MFIIGLKTESRLIAGGCVYVCVWEMGGGQGTWGVTANRYGIPFGDFEIVLKLVAMVAKLRE